MRPASLGTWHPRRKGGGPTLGGSLAARPPGGDPRPRAGSSPEAASPLRWRPTGRGHRLTCVRRAGIR
eukprot:3679394-Heterocapsa_arctica.AAC.1